MAFFRCMPFPRFAFIAAGLVLGGILAPAALARAPAYKGAIIVDAATGKALFADNADESSPPASMTKLMTFAVLQDAIRRGTVSLDTPVRIVPADTRTQPSIIGLKPGETFPLEELVYAMMIPSANDAAQTVARVVAGSVPAFVDLMNAKARDLGMTRTTFRTPNGLPVRGRRVADGDLTTPRDFAILCRYVLQKTNVLKYTSVRTRNFGTGYRFPPTPMTNHNHLLGRIEGVDGLKTGFTNGAGFCLATTAQRGGRRIIVVLMDSPDSKSRDLKVAELIDRGFSLLPLFPPPGAVSFPAASPSAPPAAASAMSAPSRPAPASPPPDSPMPTIQFHPPR
jgi:D-alanyl-D-alanine carboxypeptidase (penicillin-binding protein 5/6)